MDPDEVGALFASLGEASVSGGGAHARATVDVPADRWAAAISAARDAGFDFFDWLSAVDEAETFRVVAHVWSVRDRHGLLLRTLLPAGGGAGVDDGGAAAAGPAALDSVVEIYPGAAWHERETHEMFGIDFTGHPGLTPLLLPPEFEGHPLRKDFVLASRVAKPWPGAKEPGGDGPKKRAPMRPPGVPAEGEWGSRA